MKTKGRRVDGLRQGKAVPKRKAIAVLSEVIAFAGQAVVAFSDLRSRSQILQTAVIHNQSDPLTEEQLQHFDKLLDDWESVAKTL